MAERQGLAFFELYFPSPRGVNLYLAGMFTPFCRPASSFLFTLVSWWFLLCN